MRCCRKHLRNLLVKLTLLLSLLCCSAIVNAEGIAVSKAEVRHVDDGYEVVADFKITLPPSVADALIHGVILNFVSELSITRSRWYWLDSDVVQAEQVTKLSYNALTRQYRISRGTLFQGFPNLESALRILGRQVLPPISESVFQTGTVGYVAKVLKSETRYTAFAQMRLDVSQLPKPLQVTALTNSEWDLASEK
ncbi:MAG: DUF4390 domain-containing protein, partial [Gallionellaceae bacterium]|nr:DUF4390 domain-containing protein [Gallionellaceae bacterium]